MNAVIRTLVTRVSVTGAAFAPATMAQAPLS